MSVQTQWSTTKGLDNQRILAKLPPALRGDILEAINDDLVKLSPIFQVPSCCPPVTPAKIPLTPTLLPLLSFSASRTSVCV